MKNNHFGLALTLKSKTRPPKQRTVLSGKQRATSGRLFPQGLSLEFLPNLSAIPDISILSFTYGRAGNKCWLGSHWSHCKGSFLLISSCDSERRGTDKTVPIRLETRVLITRSANFLCRCQTMRIHERSLSARREALRRAEL